MTSLEQLNQKIEERSAILGVVGLGMVGLPVACAFAQTGFRVIGVDLKAERVAIINAGRSPMTSLEPGLPELLAEVVQRGRFQATTEYAALRSADILTLNVETPVDANHQPDYRALRAACQSLGAVLRRGALVIVESTVAPGTTSQVVGPLLEEASGLHAHHDFFLGACPERVMPGKLLANLRQVSRVCGGGTPDTAQTMCALYRTIVEAELDASDPLTAELVKTTENAYRDVQIAFANEVAQICEASGADVWQVRDLVNKSPGRAMHLPGAGVGGHCIPKDPWLLANAAGDPARLQVIPAARAVNDGMPAHVVSLLESGLAALGRELAGSRIAVLGYAYLEESDDDRNSPSAALVERLAKRGAEILIHDPFVPNYQGDVWQALAGSDAAVLMVAHRLYRTLDLGRLRRALRTPLLVDGRHNLDAAQARAAGLHYVCLGVGSSSPV
jgi:UDP-N-acetyl-D-mannosaminuronic acid dehydrogenase